MLAKERKDRIIELLKIQNSVKVADLSESFAASEPTIRRDLQELEDEGLLKRTHGGAMKMSKTAMESNISDLALTHVREKRAIAYEAYKLINDNDSIIVDSSSTTGLIAEFLKLEERKNITVITNSFQIISSLMDTPTVELIHLGGQVRKNIRATVGPLAEATLNSLRIDKAFIGVNGIDFQSGITTPNIFDSHMKTTILGNSNRRYIMADSSKFGETYLSVICKCADVDAIITDSLLSASFSRQMDSLGIDYILADVNGF